MHAHHVAWGGLHSVRVWLACTSAFGPHNRTCAAGCKGPRARPRMQVISDSEPGSNTFRQRRFIGGKQSNAEEGDAALRHVLARGAHTNCWFLRRQRPQRNPGPATRNKTGRAVCGQECATVGFMKENQRLEGRAGRRRHQSSRSTAEGGGSARGCRPLGGARRSSLSQMDTHPCLCQRACTGRGTGTACTVQPRWRGGRDG